MAINDACIQLLYWQHPQVRYELHGDDIRCDFNSNGEMLKLEQKCSDLNDSDWINQRWRMREGNERKAKKQSLAAHFFAAEGKWKGKPRKKNTPNNRSMCYCHLPLLWLKNVKQGLRGCTNIHCSPCAKQRANGWVAVQVREKLKH